MANRDTIIEWNIIFEICSKANILPYNWNRNKLRFEIKSGKASAVYRRLYALYIWCHLLLLIRKLYLSHQEKNQSSVIEVIIHLCWIIVYFTGSITQLTLKLHTSEIIEYMNHLIHVSCTFQGKYSFFVWG